MYFEALQMLAQVDVVSLDEAKEQSIVAADNTDDDAQMYRCVLAAVRYAEQYTGRSLLLKRYRASAECWPCDRTATLLHGPVRLIESVAYKDIDGVDQVLPADAWQVMPRRGHGFLRFFDALPPLSPRHLDPVRIEYLAGYGPLPSDDENSYAEGYPVEYASSNDLLLYAPDNIKHAIRGLAAFYYENREAVAVGTIATALPHFVAHILDQEMTFHL